MTDTTRHGAETEISVRPLAAGELSPGSLTGHEARCGSCGFRAATSLSALFALRDAQEHVSYMIRKEAGR